MKTEQKRVMNNSVMFFLKKYKKIKKRGINSFLYYTRGILNLPESIIHI